LRFFGAVFFAAATCYSYRNGSDPSPNLFVDKRDR